MYEIYKSYHYVDEMQDLRVPKNMYDVKRPRPVLQYILDLPVE